MKAELVQQNNVEKIKINDKIYDPISFRSFWPRAETVNNFSRHGFELMSLFPTGVLCSLKVPYSQFGEVWEGEGRYNWDNLHNQVDMFMKNAPDSKFSLLVHLDTRDWFLQENPETAHSFFHLAQTAGYQKWRESAAAFMCDMIDHLDEYCPEKVFSIFLFAGATCEWFTTTDSEEHQELKEKIYQQWTQDANKKIPSAESLHHTEYGIFRHPENDKEALEHWHFHNEIIADAICWFAKVAKDHTKNSRLVGVFYGYLTGMISKKIVNRSHNALIRVMKNPNVDLFFAPASYIYRSLKSTSAFVVPTDSIRLHNKLYFHEIDNTTHLSNDNEYAQILQRTTNSSPHSRMENMYQTVMYSRRESALALSKGQGYWWFDMFSGWYDDEELMQELEQIRTVTAKLYQCSMRSTSEVAVLVDQESNYYADYNSRLNDSVVVQQVEELQRMGLPWDCYVSEDIVNENMPHQQYKLYIFLNLFKPTKEILDKIKELKASGKSMLFVYAAGLITDTGFSVEAMNDVTGIKTKETKDTAETHVSVPEGKYNQTKAVIHYGMYQAVVPMFEAVDETCTVIGRYKDSGKAGFVLKKRETGFDSWSAVGGIPGMVLKELARQAGVFVYSETDEPLYANESMIGLFSHTGGKRVLKVPFPGKLTEVYSAQEYTIESGTVQLEFKPDEMKVFQINR